jgi:hypothetical protein
LAGLGRAKTSLRENVIIPFHSTICARMYPLRKFIPNKMISVINSSPGAEPIADKNLKKTVQKSEAND